MFTYYASKTFSALAQAAHDPYFKYVAVTDDQEQVWRRVTTSWAMLSQLRQRGQCSVETAIPLVA